MSPGMPTCRLSGCDARRELDLRLRIAGRLGLYQPDLTRTFTSDVTLVAACVRVSSLLLPLQRYLNSRTFLEENSLDEYTGGMTIGVSIPSSQLRPRITRPM
jgi:hypothetical protein